MRPTLHSLYSSSSSSSSSNASSSSSSSSDSSDDDDSQDSRRRRRRRQQQQHEKRRADRRRSSLSDGSASDTSSAAASISGAESISDGSLPSSPRADFGVAAAAAADDEHSSGRLLDEQELEQVSPDRAVTPRVMTPDCDRITTPTLVQPEHVSATAAGDSSPPSSPASLILQDHSYSLPPKEQPELVETAALDHDHGYTRILQKSPAPEQAVVSKTKTKVKEKKAAAAAAAKKLRDEARAAATESQVAQRRTPEPTEYPPRDLMEEMAVFYEFLAKGIDQEDIAHLQKSYEALLSSEALQVSCSARVSFSRNGIDSNLRDLIHLRLELQFNL